MKSIKDLKRMADDLVAAIQDRIDEKSSNDDAFDESEEAEALGEAREYAENSLNALETL